MLVNIDGEMLVGIEARKSEESHQFMTRVLPVMAAIRPVARIGIVDVRSGDQPGDIFQSSNVWCADQKDPRWLEHPPHLVQRRNWIHLKMLENLAEHDDIEGLIRIRKR